MLCILLGNLIRREFMISWNMFKVMLLEMILDAIWHDVLSLKCGSKEDIGDVLKIKEII
jgi:hypothetical protein